MSEAALDMTEKKPGRPRKDAAERAWKREFILRRTIQQTPAASAAEADKAWQECGGDPDLLDFVRLNAGNAMGLGGLLRVARQTRTVLP
jgi:hypothetical protein